MVADIGGTETLRVQVSAFRLEDCMPYVLMVFDSCSRLLLLFGLKL